MAAHKKPKFFDIRPRSRRGRKIAPWWLLNRAPDDLCGGRRLAGAEFKKRAAELEAADRERRRKTEVVT